MRDIRLQVLDNEFFSKLWEDNNNEDLPTSFNVINIAYHTWRCICDMFIEMSARNKLPDIHDEKLFNVILKTNKSSRFDFLIWLNEINQSVKKKQGTSPRGFAWRWSLSVEKKGLGVVVGLQLNCPHCGFSTACSGEWRTFPLLHPLREELEGLERRGLQYLIDRGCSHLERTRYLSLVQNP